MALKKRDLLLYGDDSAPTIKEQDFVRRVNAGKGFGSSDSLSQGHSVTDDSSATPPAIAATPAIEGNDSAAQEDVATADDNAASDPAPVEETPAVQPSDRDFLKVSRDELEAIISAKLQPVKAELEQERDAAAMTAQKIQDELAAVKAERDRLASVFEVMGDSKPVQAPNVSTKGIYSDSPKGAAKEFYDVLQSSPGGVYTCPISGLRAHHRDDRQARRWLRAQQADQKTWVNVLKDIEDMAKGFGYLRGGDATGPTTGSTATNAFLDTLSAMLRETHNQHNIFWQFAMTAYDPSAVPSKQILVPRFSYLGFSSTIADYTLATVTTYNTTAGPIGSSADSQSLDMTTVPVPVEEYGLGRSVDVNSRPVYIPEFHQQISLVDLMRACQTRLMQHYYRFEETKLRIEFEKATEIRYNLRGTVTESAGDIAVAGDGADMTEDFLNSQYSVMLSDQIPSLPNSRYYLAINPTSAAQLKSSLGDKMQAPTPDQVLELTNMMTAATGVEIGRVSGYIGSACGFEIFLGNSFGVGAAGSSATANNVAFGGSIGSKLCYDSFAFGVGPVARGVALPMEIRASGVNPFGRGESYIWLERGGYTACDVDATSVDPANQQTRVYRLRTAAVPV